MSTRSLIIWLGTDHSRLRAYEGCTAISRMDTRGNAGQQVKAKSNKVLLQWCTHPIAKLRLHCKIVIEMLLKVRVSGLAFIESQKRRLIDEKGRYDPIIFGTRSWEAHRTLESMSDWSHPGKRTQHCKWRAVGKILVLWRLENSYSVLDEFWVIIQALSAIGTPKSNAVSDNLV